MTAFLAAALGASLGLAASPVASWDLELTDGGLVSGGTLGQWGWGLPTVGPSGGASGTLVWGTALDGNYANNSLEWLTLPPHDLSGVAEPMLAFWSWHELASGDVGRVEVLDEGTWTTLAPVYGPATLAESSGGWQPLYLDLRGVGALDQVRLVLATNPSGSLAGWYVDDFTLYDGDAAPPAVGPLDDLPDSTQLEGPYRAGATVLDDRAAVSVVARWDAGGVLDSAPMTPVGRDRWEVDLPGQAPDTTVSWWVEASDGPNLAVSDPDSFRVYLPAPQDLRGPEGRVVDVRASLTWTPPETELAVVSYVVERAGQPVVDVVGTEATVELVGEGADVFTVRASFEAGLGDASGPLVLDSYVPRIESVQPDRVFAGDRVWLQVEGSYLLLQAADLEVALGSGVTVTDVEVRDVDRLVLGLEVASTADLGPRDLVLWAGGVEVVAGAAFEVVDGASRPRLLAITPDTLEQGERATVRIEATADLAATPSVDLGAGVVVESVVLAGAREVTVVAVVEPVAPVGARSVVVDDGVRLLTGVELTVEDPGVGTSRSCAAGPGGAGAGPARLAALLVLLGLARGRLACGHRVLRGSRRPPARWLAALAERRLRRWGGRLRRPSAPWRGRAGTPAGGAR